jgi:hypothetical protein
VHLRPRVIQCLIAALLAAAVKEELAELDGHGDISAHSPSVGQGYRRLLALIMAVDDANRHRNARLDRITKAIHRLQHLRPHKAMKG